MTILEDLKQAVTQCDTELTMRLVKKAVADEVPVDQIIKDGIIRGMKGVGDLFNNGEYFLPELLVAGQRTVVPEDRLPFYREAQQIIHRDAPWVPLVHTMELAAMRRDVTGYRLHPTGRVLLSRVTLAR